MAACVTYVFLIVTSSILVWVAGQQGQEHHSQTGRNVCTRWSHVRKSVPSRQSYRRPVYREDLGRMTYQVAYRTTWRMRYMPERVKGCCQGWEKVKPEDEHCLKPQCSSECEHGKCVGPEICMCEAGFSGHRCQIELDECTGRHKCHQKCINTVGSYECACHEGFKMAEDGFTCNLCLSCIGEFQELQSKIANLTVKVQDMEEEKQTLQQNLTSALSQLQASSLTAVTSSPQPLRDVTEQQQYGGGEYHQYEGSYSSSDYGGDMGYDTRYRGDRMTSLSEQISLLEEKMADCQCNGGDHAYYP